jgi:hypothetical protein
MTVNGVVDGAPALPDDHEAPRAADASERRRTRLALIAIATGFVAVVAAMVGALFLDPSEESVGAAREPVRAACRAARDSLRELGSIDPSVSDAELADRVDVETAILGRMVAAFADADPGTDDGRAALLAWRDDWERLLAARDDAAERIRTGERPAAWLPPESEGSVKAIDGRMDEYAQREGLVECTTNALEADNLDGQRVYRDPEGS